MGLVGRGICYTQGLIFYFAPFSGRPTLMAARITWTLFDLTTPRWPEMPKESLFQFSLRTLLLGAIVVGSATGLFLHRTQSVRIKAQARADAFRAGCIANLVEQLVEKGKQEKQKISFDKQRASLASTTDRQTLLNHLFMVRNSRGIRGFSDPDCDELKAQLNRLILQEGNDHRFVVPMKDIIRDWDCFFEILHPDLASEVSSEHDDLQMEPEETLRLYIRELEKGICDIERIVKKNSSRLIQFREMAHCVE